MHIPIKVQKLKNSDDCIMLIEGDEREMWFTKDDKRYLVLIKQLLWMFDKHIQSQILILNDVFRRAQEIMIWMKNQLTMQDFNRVNFNMKIITLTQIVEDILFRKSIEDKELMLRELGFIQAIAKLVLVLDEKQLLYFDFPYCPILD